MRSAILPREMRGQWIWKQQELHRPVSYAFFRRDFALTEVPSTADVYICVHGNYHLLINGRHVGRGPAPAVGRAGYVTYYNVAFCLQVGRNVLAVVANNCQISRVHDERREAGLWAQLDVDGQPLLWTDDQWQGLPGDCYHNFAPRSSAGGEWVESIDLRHYPAGWDQLDQPRSPDGSEVALPWETVAVLGDVQRHEVMGSPEVEHNSDLYNFFTLRSRGTCTQARLATHVCFGQGLGAGDGVYAAETWIHCEQALGKVPFELHADDPYCLFLNNRLVKQQGSLHFEDGSDPRWHEPRCYQQDDVAEPAGRLALSAGANRLTLVQQVGKASCGATLIFPTLEPRQLKLARGDSPFSLPGWNLVGPLRVPLAQVLSPLRFEGLEMSTFHGRPPIDAAAWLTSYDFELAEDAQLPVEELSLRHEQFAVVELEHYLRGCPQFTISGTSGDILDIVFGDCLPEKGVLPTLVEGTRRVATVVLADEPMEWRSLDAAGCRCVMLVARQARDTIKVQQLGWRRMIRHYREPAQFSCSEELLNQIWEVGLNTIDATSDGVFHRAGGLEGGQLLSDAMIQALCGFYAFGSYGPSEKALREFARAQYETGEMPVAAPSDFAVRLYDMALLWPIWLRHHVMHSGDLQFLEEMLPYLRKLLAFFAGISSTEQLLLGDPAGKQEWPFLIDYDPSLDRRGISTALNSIYVLSLLKSQWLFQQANLQDEARDCHDRALQVARTVRRLAWNEEKGLFADGWYNGRRSPNYSTQTNVLAVYSVVAAEDTADRIFHNLFLDYAPFIQIATDAATENPYFKYFLLDIMFSVGWRDWAVDYLRYYWGTMLARGADTWWQRFSPRRDRGIEAAGNVCQGYGVAPNYFLITEIAGIRPAAPGYHQIYLNPLLSAVEWVKVQVPTPRGTLHVDWGWQEDGSLEIAIFSTFPVEVAPLLDPSVARNAVLHVSDEVTILDTSASRPQE